MKYTAEEVREWAAFAQAQGKLYAPMKGAHEPWEKLEAMLTAYADSIKADEVAADYPECSGDPSSCSKAHAEAITLHPPAQAAQSEDWRIAFFERWHEAAQEKGYVGNAAAITAVPAAEPVAQPSDSGRVPDGWMLVPREPTKAMLDAAMAREDDEPLTDWGKIIPAPHAEIYKAMLTAVPQLGEPT